MEAGLPNITGDLDTAYVGLSIANAEGVGALDYMYKSVTTNLGWFDSAPYSRGIHFDAYKSNVIYGNSTTVQPASLTSIYVIKY